MSDRVMEQDDASAPGGATTMATTAATGVPVIIQNPVVHLLEAGGTDDTDVSCDIGRIELSPDQAVTEVVRFCGTVQVPGLLTESCSVDYVINDTTAATWAKFVGKKVTVKVWESKADAKGRVFESYVGFNPGMYGSFTPGEPLLLTGQSLPVMSAIKEGSAAPS